MSKENKRSELEMMTPEPYVTADDIAEHLKITRRQVLEMTRRGIIPAHPLGAGEHRRVWRFKISELEAAIASGARKPSASHDDEVLAETPARRTMPDGSPRSQKGKL
jgi:excisionase family DNA binding protein